MTLQFNPFAVVNHNQHRWPRVGFHLAHVAVGLPAWLLGRWFGLPWAVVALAALGLALLDKCIWIDWKRTSGSVLHWTELHGLDDLWHFTTDAVFTLLGAFLPVWWLALAVYYPCSIVNDV